MASSVGIWDITMFVVFLFGLILMWCNWKIGKFKRKGVKTLTPYPIIGNMGTILRKKMHLSQLVVKTYNSFPDDKYVGIFHFQRPNLLIKDLDLIKQIAIKDFDHFEDHQSFLDIDNEPVFGRVLTALTGQKWRDMRATLSPAFTSSKMRNMYLLVDECAQHLSEYYTKKINDEPDKDFLELDMKDTFTRYANDVIATTAFGIKIDSLTEQDDIFYTMGKKATNFTSFQLLKSIILIFSPSISKLLKITLFDKKLTNFFRNLVSSQIKHRTDNNVIRSDMLHLLMEAKRGSLKHESEKAESDMGFSTVQESAIGSRTVKSQWEDDDITAQALLFFFAGFDTISTFLSFMAIELAINRDVQKKLQREVDELIKCHEKITYNEIQNMKYMDMVVSETLRLWSPAPMTDRRCSKPYVLPSPTPNGKPYKIEVNDGIWIPVCAIHRDPTFYKNPDKFDPERFSDENKSSIQPFTYLPFGLGPRNCIGSRFALMEGKSIIFHLLSKFDLVATPKTCNPPVPDPAAFNMTLKGGFWVGLKLRQ